MDVSNQAACLITSLYTTHLSLSSRSPPVDLRVPVSLTKGPGDTPPPPREGRLRPTSLFPPGAPSASMWGKELGHPTTHLRLGNLGEPPGHSFSVRHSWMPHKAAPAQPALPMLQALAEIPRVVLTIAPLQGSSGTQEVHGIRPPGPSPDSCIPRALNIPPFLYSSFFPLDFLFA